MHSFNAKHLVMREKRSQCRHALGYQPERSRKMGFLRTGHTHKKQRKSSKSSVRLNLNPTSLYHNSDVLSMIQRGWRHQVEASNIM